MPGPNPNPNPQPQPHPNVYTQEEKNDQYVSQMFDQVKIASVKKVPPPIPPHAAKPLALALALTVARTHRGTAKKVGSCLALTLTCSP